MGAGLNGVQRTGLAEMGVIELPSARLTEAKCINKC